MYAFFGLLVVTLSFSKLWKGELFILYNKKPLYWFIIKKFFFCMTKKRKKRKENGLLLDGTSSVPFLLYGFCFLKGAASNNRVLGSKNEKMILVFKMKEWYVRKLKSTKQVMQYSLRSNRITKTLSLGSNKILPKNGEY